MSDANTKPDPTKLPKNSLDYVSEFQLSLQKNLPSNLFIVLILGLVISVPGLMISSFTPAINVMAADYQVPVSDIQALVGTYLIGFSIGQLIWGPLVDRFGRRMVTLVSTVLLLVANTYLVTADSYHQLQISRIMQGICVAGIRIIPTTTLRDIYSTRQFVIMNSWLMMLFLVVPACAPILGGYILLTLGWAWIFNISSIMILIGCAFYFYFIPETLDPTKVQSIKIPNLINNYKRIFTNRKAILLIVISIASSIGNFLTPTLMPATLLNDYHLSPDVIGYYIASSLVFNIAGNRLNGYLAARMHPQNVWLMTSIMQSVIGIINIVVAMYFLGLWAFVIGVGFSIFFHGPIVGNSTGIYLSQFKDIAGTASSVMSSIRFFAAGMGSYIFAQFDSNNGATLLIGLSIVSISGMLLTALYYYLYPVKGDLV